MGAGSVGWINANGSGFLISKKAKPVDRYDQRALLCAFGALLEVEQPLGLHPAGIAQTCDIDPRR